MCHKHLVNEGTRCAMQTSLFNCMGRDTGCVLALSTWVVMKPEEIGQCLSALMECSALCAIRLLWARLTRWLGCFICCPWPHLLHFVLAPFSCASSVYGGKLSSHQMVIPPHVRRGLHPYFTPSSGMHPFPPSSLYKLAPSDTFKHLKVLSLC